MSPWPPPDVAECWAYDTYGYRWRVTRASRWWAAGYAGPWTGWEA